MHRLLLLSTLFLSLIINGLAQGVEWAHALGGEGNDTATSLCTDNNSNTYYVARFAETMDTDPGIGENMITAQETDSYISKINPQGEHEWTLQLISDDDVYASTIKEFDGNLFITGQFRGTTDFDPGAEEFLVSGPASSGLDIFLLKLSIDGDFEWVKTWGTDDGYGLSGLAIDSEENIYLGGAFDGSIDVDPGPGEVVFSNSFGKAMLIKLDSNGDYIWSHFIGDPEVSVYSYDRVISCDIDAEDNLIITGKLQGSFDYDLGEGEEIYSNSESVSFVCKYDSDANLIWSRFIENYGDLGSCTLDNNGNVIVGGRFSGSVDFNTDPDAELFLQNSSDYWDIFVLKINSNGSFGWAVSFGGDNFPAEHCWALACDINNSIYATGAVCASGDLDPGSGEAPFSVDGLSDLFVTKFDQNGNYQWSYTAGGNEFLVSDAQGIGLHVDPSGKAYVLGYYSNNIDFGPLSSGEFESAGSYDLFLIKIDESITSIAEMENSSVILYPNPTSSVLRLTSDHQIQKVEIFDQSGRLVHTQSMKHGNSISVKQLSPGNYILRAFSSDGVSMEKFIVQR